MTGARDRRSKLTPSARRRPFAWLTFWAACVLVGCPASPALAQAYATLGIGSPLVFNVGEDLSFQVANLWVTTNPVGQVYPSNSLLGDMGVFLRTRSANPVLIAPDFTKPLHGSTGTGALGPRVAWTPVSISPVTGSGAPTNPMQVTVVATAPGGIILKMTVLFYSSIQTHGSFRVICEVTCATAQSFSLFLGGDFYMATADLGIPLQLRNAVGGRECSTSPYRALLVPAVPPSADHYVAGSYTTVWSEIGAGRLSDTVAAGCIDNAAALQWDLTCAASQTVRVEAVAWFDDAPSGLGCTEPPRNLALWLPFDETAGTAVHNIAGPVSGTASAPLFFAPYGKVDNCAGFDGTYVEVADHSAVSIGQGDFSLCCWVSQSPMFAFGPQAIADKRILIGSAERGFSLYLDSGVLKLRLGDGIGPPSYTEYTGPLVMPGPWSHVAVVVTRNSPNGVMFYVDGTPVPPTGSADTTSENGPIYGGVLRVASSSLVPYDEQLIAYVDELQVFKRAISASEVKEMYDADAGGVCKHFCQVDWDVPFWESIPAVTTTARICNGTGTAVTYNFSFSPLSSCGSVPGPAGITSNPSSPVVVPANTCIPLTLTIPRPAFSQVGDVACYRMWLSPVGNRVETYVCDGSVVWTGSLCADFADGCCWWDLPTRAAQTLGPITVVNTGTTAVSLPFDIKVIGPGMEPDLASVSLNGAEPGAPFTGLLSLAPGSSQLIDLTAEFLADDPLGWFTILVRADLNGDGITDPLTSASIRNRITCDADLNADGVVDFPDYLLLLNYIDVQDLRADLNRDGIIDISDYIAFLGFYDAGC